MEEFELIEIPQEIEDLAYFLTLMLGHMVPAIDRGETYSELVAMLIKFQEEQLKVNEAKRLARTIMATQTTDGRKVRN